MNLRLQWKASAVINAPLEKVWDKMQDISLISGYHPVVTKVEFLSGQKTRAPGVEYQCFVTEGPKKGSCVERVVENIPYKKTSTLSVSDTWGLSKMLKNFVTESTLEKLASDKTVLIFTGYYEPRDFKAKIMNVLFLKKIMKKRGIDVISGIKNTVENLK